MHAFKTTIVAFFLNMIYMRHRAFLSSLTLYISQRNASISHVRTAIHAVPAHVIDRVVLIKDVVAYSSLPDSYLHHVVMATVLREVTIRAFLLCPCAFQ